MADKNIIETRPTADENKEIRSRVSELSHKKLKRNNKYGRKQTRCLSLSASLYPGKDVGTPKSRSRARCNDCSNSDSPSEAETLQDIIWDPASPPLMRNGKEAGATVRVMDISEIVNRIAPNDEKPMDKGSVLHWIGDTAIPCTPQIQQPKVWRCSSSRQINNVEDLMKLAKQFDLNMTRQHKERNLERLQNSEGTNCKDLRKLNKITHPESESNGASASEAKGLSHEEELHALFDGPTQHLSGRLSPPSTNCSQESRTDETATHRIKPATSDSKNLPAYAQVSKPDFDDDWDSDDLLGDLFVLEVTQSPQLLSSCTAKTTSQTKSAASRVCEPTMAGNSSGSSSGSGCPKSPQITNRYTRISTKTFISPSTLRSDGPVQSGAVKQLPKTSSAAVNTDSKYQKEQALGIEQQIVMSNVGPGAKDLGSSVGALGKDLGSLWGDGDDDELLYQACDDLERITASQEHQKDKNSTKPLHSSCEVPSYISSSSSSMSRNSRTLQSQHCIDHKEPVCVFAHTHSIPGASKISTRQLYNFTQLRHITGPAGENTHHSTFKRHQSDPGVRKNKVFITAQPAVKCSAAEIEIKKLEAIARRKLRLQAIQKPGTPT